MFYQPTKGDLDRQLSTIMHEARHQALDERNKLTSGAILAGALHGSRLTINIAGATDRAHKDAIAQAVTIMRNFAERIAGGPKQITEWARPHLENMGNSLLAVIPVNDHSDGQRVRAQYDAVFKQRLDGALRDVEIGFVRGSGFITASVVSDKPKEIVGLKPGLWGFSIDLREAWKRFRKR